jgi:hypothetical protein
MISPQETFVIYLDEYLPADKRLTESQRPALVYRYGTAGELAIHEDRMEAARKLFGGVYIREMIACAKHNLVKTRNLTTPQGNPTDELEQALSLPELCKLAGQLSLKCELSSAERKNSESQSLTPVAAAAEIAQPGQAKPQSV